MQNLSISTILVPVDFSRRAEGAVRSAQDLAAHFGAEMILLHVVEPFQLDYAMVEPFESPLRELAQAHRSKKQAELDVFCAHELKDMKVTRMIVEGDPAEQILECSKQKNASLIVMPTQGHGRLRSLLIGSVTAKVLDESERPVLTGTHLSPEGQPSDWQIRHILCAVDLGSRSDCVTGWGAALAKEFQAKVTVLHVASDQEAGKNLDKIVAAAGLDSALLIADGEPHKVVAFTAEELQADLIVIGRGTATSTMGRLRAQAYGIVRSAPCPVLSV